MRTTIMRRGLALAVVALAAMSTAALAQSSRTLLVRDLSLQEQARIQSEAEARRSEASELLRRAREAEAQGEWRSAARLYETSAGLRVDGDRLGQESFELAGRAYHYADDLGRASRMLEEAANRALIIGDVFGAARNYIKSALAAQEDGQRERAAQVAWKAYHLSQSEHLTSTQRNLLGEQLKLKASS